MAKVCFIQEPVHSKKDTCTDPNRDTCCCVDSVLPSVVCPGQNLDSITISGYINTHYVWIPILGWTTINYVLHLLTMAHLSFGKPPAKCISGLPKVSLPHFVNHWHLSVKVETLVGKLENPWEVDHEFTHS